MLYYRFPGEEIQCLKGNFIEVESIDKQNFVITNFNQSIKYTWSENAKAQSATIAAPVCIDEATYLSCAEQLIKDLNRGLADKIVLSRIKKASQAVTDPLALFKSLAAAYPTAFVYYFYDTCIGSWIGASPEILIARQNKHWTTMALAGTKPTADARDFTFKEYNEHAMVTEFIEGQIKQIPGAQLQISELQTYSPGPVSHLLQELTWQMPDTVFPLLLKHLHPTPAVAGLPQKVALQYLAATETHERAFYAGIIGRCTNGQEKLYVNLRCGQLLEEHLYLYLGGGFTPDSSAKDEWEETENKSQTLLRLL
ncbi:MAG: chorismate-binding protein [Flavobacteriales bacterium]